MKSFFSNINFSISIVVIIVVTYFFKEFTSFIPIVFGIVLGLIFAPILIFLQKKKVPTSLSILIILGIFLASSAFLSSILASSLYGITSNLDTYHKKISDLGVYIQNQFGSNNTDVIANIQSFALDYLQKNILSYSTTILQSITKFSSQFLIVAITMVFFLIERTGLSKKLNRFLEQQHKFNEKSIGNINKPNKEDIKIQGQSLTSLIENINTQVSRFLFLKTIISGITAIAVYVGFKLIGVDFAFIWAILTFLLNFIPTIGSIVITILSVLFAILQFFPLWSPVIAVIILTLSIQMIIGNFLDPKIMGDSLNLSPLVIWLSLIYWGWVWGIAGALLAIPLTVTIRLVCDYIPSLKGIGILMGSPKSSKPMKNITKMLEKNKRK